MEKVVLAYSGGLGTTIAIHWLRHYRNLEVITFAANLGFGEYLESLGERALNAGASAAHIIDLRERFMKHYVFPAYKAGARYASGYLLSSAISRPLIVEQMVKLAEENACSYIAHGSTGKGNDQLRFESCAMALNPNLRVLAPVREWNLRTPEERLAYAKRNGLPIPPADRHQRSVDGNLWGVSIEAPCLEDLTIAPPEDLFYLTAHPTRAPDRPTVLTLEFEKGEPKKLDGEEISPVDLVNALNPLGGKYGIGRTDAVEDRAVGIKTREVYEAPGATILYTAHQALEDITLSRTLKTYKLQTSRQYGELLYHGYWFSQAREALDAFTVVTQKYVTGTIKVELSPGTCRVVSRESPYTLYDRRYATYTADDRFEHASGTGFSHLWSLEMKEEARRKRKANIK